MGVMRCSRLNCNSIMCDTYVDSIGYVCFSCQEEFKIYLTNWKINVSCEGEIKIALEKFMDTTKSNYNKGDKISVDDFFNNYTK